LLAPYKENVEYWTSGNNLGCDNQLRWCSRKNNDYAKENLNWIQPKKNNSCVSIVLENTNGADPQLRTADCNTTKRFICEVIATFPKRNLFAPLLLKHSYLCVKSQVDYQVFQVQYLNEMQFWFLEDQ
jgi:hypothetical protein